MGIEAALASTLFTTAGGTAITGASILSGLSTGLSLFSGLQSMGAGNAQAKQANAQAAAQAAEQTRISTREAYQEEQAASGARRQQKLAYLASGVSLSGSPLLIMEETRRKGAANAEEIRRAGASSSTAYMQEGRLTASRLKKAGRNEFISGVTGALKKYAD